MSVHDPEGSSVCIHAVCVSPDHRHKGIALSLLKEYLARLERARQEGAKYERVLLITHEAMRGLYDKAGFEFLGKSDVVTQSFEIMQTVLTRYRLAGYPPDVLVSIPRDACRSLDFHRAEEMIAIGRTATEHALDQSGLEASRHADHG